ncbi:hypothetical protein GCM10017668_37000 [Streptomyces tuirus]|uniref:Uncharacterized protein n=1 Tax=Streptomyces tuirus TaxID=68278 RepID=A0A7G1NJB8_9ACTN|nr:hypothetical protein GCM10017668_37000 [Streptomyces tuirus]
MRERGRASSIPRRNLTTLRGSARRSFLVTHLHRLGTLDPALSEIFMPDCAERLDAAKELLSAGLYGDADGPAESGRDADAAPQAHQIERGAAGNHGESS